MEANAVAAIEIILPKLQQYRPSVAIIIRMTSCKKRKVTSHRVR